MAPLESNATLPASTAPTVVPSPLVTFEQALASNLRWAMSEGSLFFDGKGRVQRSLSRIARTLSDLDIPYAVAGGMALFAHGHRRFTEDIDILITRDDLERVHDALDGRGWVRPFSKSKNLRDADTGVRVDFLIAGQYPGDGKPKPIEFPAPANAAVEIDGIKYVRLPTLVELKLASGMTGGTHRAKDLADVGELIKTLDLPESFADCLHEYVGPTYRDIWRGLHADVRRYVMAPEDAGDQLEDMLALGVMHEPPRLDRDRPLLVTSDPKLAARFGMIDETEFFE